MKLHATIHVLCGEFASQQLAYAHLLDVAEAAGLSADFDHVDVLATRRETRLAAVFDRATSETLLRAAAGETLVLVLPGALVTGAFPETERLRDLGRHRGLVTRAALP